MSQKEKLTELFYPGLNPREYSENSENHSCFFCKGKSGDKYVVEINGVAVLARIEIEVVAFERDGFDISYPVCLKCQNFLGALMSSLGRSGSLKRLESLPVFPGA